MACALASIFFIGILYLYLRRQNRNRENLSSEERRAWIEQGRTGDAHPDYRFIL